ncbi:MAG: DNA polymerase III subunit gamma/tau [Cyanobacteria bacterium J06621_8]
MPYEPLHHKYRPQTFADLVGQEMIALTLSNALKQGRIAPAYLFTGPRGTGKTSSARILAKSLNCLTSSQPTPEPCGQCEACQAIAKGSALDVMEIDAASNTGVDNIREIIERSRFAPVQCRYKIYAIDECHMLSTAAFNALLKTLEEPPPQVVFILATTDPQRVLSTIISRCQRFDYRRIPLTEMTAHLRYIADAEEIAIADDALTLISQIANGGLRDAESLLDQLSLMPEKISVAKVWDLVGAVPEQDLLILLQAIRENDALAVIQQCRSLLDRGKEPLVVLQNLASFYLNLLLAKTAPQDSSMTTVTETCWQELATAAKNWDTALILRGQQHLKDAETQLKQTTQPRLWLEVTLLGLLPKTSQAIASTEITVANPLPVPNQSSPQSSVAPQPTATTQVRIEPASPPAAALQVKSEQIPEVAQHPSTAARESKPPQQQPVASTKSFEESTVPKVDPKSEPLTPPVETASQTAEPDVSSINQQDPLANQEIWGKVVSCLQPPTTQALVKQQCHLVGFDGVCAIVGISSARLQKLNQGKVPNIEAAFAQVCQRQVKVQLEVANAQDNAAKNSVTQVKQPPQAITNSQQPIGNGSVASRQNKDLDRTPQQPPKASVAIQKPAGNGKQLSGNGLSNSTKNEHHSPPHQQPSESTLTKATTPSIDLSSETKLETLPPSAAEVDFNQAQESNSDSLQQAIDSLTQSFEGELVQLDRFSGNTPDVMDDVTEITPTLVSSSVTIKRPVNEEDYDDDW